MSEAVKMSVEEEENQAEETAPAAKNISSELNEPRWAVVSFETFAARDLTYAQAEQKLKELEAEKVPGLCIVTNEVAEKASRTT